MLMPMPYFLRRLFLYLVITSPAGSALPSSFETTASISTPSTSSNSTGHFPSLSPLHKRSFSCSITNCPDPLYRFTHSVCRSEINACSYHIFCDDVLGQNPIPAWFRGRCSENEICDTVELYGSTRAHCVSHQFHINLAHRVGQQQVVVEAGQLGLPAGELSTAGYGVNALVVDGHGHEHESGQGVVNVASLDVVAVMAEGEEGQEAGPSNAHCESCNCAGFCGSASGGHEIYCRSCGVNGVKGGAGCF